MAEIAVNDFASDTHRRVVANFGRPRTAREVAAQLQRDDPYVDDKAYGAAGCAEYVKDLEADGLLKNLGKFESGKEALKAQDADKDVIDFDGDKATFEAAAENPRKFPHLDEDDHYVRTALAQAKLIGPDRLHAEAGEDDELV